MTPKREWKKTWTWPWADALPRRPAMVLAGLTRMKDRRARGMVWAARFKYADHYERSYEKRPDPKIVRAAYARLARRKSG